MVRNLAINVDGKCGTSMPMHIRIISKNLIKGILKCWNVAASKRARTMQPANNCQTLDLNGQSSFSNEEYGKGCGIIRLMGDVDITSEHAKCW